MTSLPLVSIICLCYNHEKFLKEALESVVQQDYPNKEIIVIDDFSTDQSVVRMEEFVRKYPEVIFIRNSFNIGNCASFNKGFERSKGEYIIDFATDDIMVPGKLSKQINKFLTLSEKYGVVYSDAEVIDEEGDFLGYHHKGTKREFFHPEGDVFKFIIQRYFICPPTMMIKRIVLEASGGYDPALAYEDFNFWVESSRSFHYSFLPEALVKRRVVKKSLSMSFYTRKNTHLFETTLFVLNKAYSLCHTEEEKQILSQRVMFEMRHATFMEEFSFAEGYKELLEKLNSYKFSTKIFYMISKNRIKFFWLYKIFLKMKGVYSLR